MHKRVGTEEELRKLPLCKLARLTRFLLKRLAKERSKLERVHFKVQKSSKYVDNECAVGFGDDDELDEEQEPEEGHAAHEAETERRLLDNSTGHDDAMTAYAIFGSSPEDAGPDNEKESEEEVVSDADEEDNEDIFSEVKIFRAIMKECKDNKRESTVHGLRCIKAWESLFTPLNASLRKHLKQDAENLPQLSESEESSSEDEDSDSSDESDTEIKKSEAPTSTVLTKAERRARKMQEELEDLKRGEESCNEMFETFKKRRLEERKKGV